MYNFNFSEDDAIELVANALQMKWYTCGWISNGQPCNTVVLGRDCSAHLKTAHGASNSPRLECLWGGNCGESLVRGCLIRHVQEKHLEWKWPCPRCGTIFTRRGVMDAHRAQCGGPSA